jgi:hypothetical protein
MGPGAPAHPSILFPIGLSRKALEPAKIFLFLKRRRERLFLPICPNAEITVPNYLPRHPETFEAFVKDASQLELISSVRVIARIRPFWLRPRGSGDSINRGIWRVLPVHIMLV